MLRLSVLQSLASTWLSPRLASLRAARPNLDVQIETSAELVDLTDDRFDAAIRFGKGRWPGLVAERLFEVRVFPVAAPGLSPLARKRLGLYSVLSATAPRLPRPTCRIKFALDSLLEGGGFELVWGFSCQVVVFGFCRFFVRSWESRSSSRRLRSGSRSARKGSRDRNGSKAWRLGRLASLVFRSALTPEHAERR
jgi:DNA-binding transcriptional LysR family regulator